MVEPLQKMKWSNNINDYEKYGHKIGRVWKARVRDDFGNNIDVLLRCIPFEAPPTDRVIESVQNLRNAGNHSKILRCYHTFWDLPSLCLNVIQEVTNCEGHYVESLISQEPFEETLIAAILKQVLKVLHYLHTSDVVWYDCRASHIYLKLDGSVAVNILSLRSILQMKTRDSLPFMAPEIILPKDRVMNDENKYKADIWSFGITALQMANGEAPYRGWSIQEMTEAIARSNHPLINPENEKKFSNQFKDMINFCLQEDPTKRPAALQLLSHEFFKKAPGKDYIKSKFFVQKPFLPQKSKDSNDTACQIKDQDNTTTNHHMRTLPVISPKDSNTDQSNPSSMVSVKEAETGVLETTTSTTTTTTVTTRTSTRTRLAPSLTKSHYRDTVDGMPHNNVPIETLLGETESKYIVFIRAIPSTRVHLYLDTQELIILGQLPPLLVVDNTENFRLVESFVNTSFERRVKFPNEICYKKELITRQLNKSTSTLRLEIPKFVPVYLGTETF